MKTDKKVYFDQSRDLLPLAFFKDKLIDKSEIWYHQPILKKTAIGKSHD